MSHLKRLAASLALCVLFFVNVDLTTSLLWCIGFGVFAVAVFQVGKQLLRDRNPLAIGVSALAVVLFPAAVVNQGLAFDDVTRAGQAMAERAAAACKRDGTCPAALDAADAGSLGVRFPVHYGRADDGRSFTVSARLNIDAALSWTGGVDAPVVKLTEM